MRKRTVALAMILAGGIAGSAAAQQAPAMPKVVAPAPAPAAAPAPAVATTQEVVLPAGTGSMVQLPKPAATVLAADPSIARVQPASPTALFIIGVAPGRTTVLATGAGGVLVRQFDVTVTPGKTPPPPNLLPPVLNVGGAAPAPKLTAADAAKTEKAIHQILPAAQRVHARVAGTEMVLTGLVATPEVAQQAMAIARGFAGGANVLDNLLVLSSVQVNLRVRICEVNRTIMRQLGINWQALGNPGNFKFGLFTGAGVTGALSALAPLSSGASAPNSIGVGYKSGPFNVDGIIDALASDDLATLLAEPNLTALSGETASFLAGGEFPVPVAAANGAGGATVSVEFKQYGVSLSFIPTVLGPDSINLKVEPSVSALTNQGAVSVPTLGGTLTIPALTVRSAKTTVELGSGQSFAIAGLLEHTSTQSISTIPGIGELPILGALFRSTQFQRGESELVIIVTPYLVKPAASPAQLAAPTDGFHPATDLDRILFGRTVSSTPAGHRIDAGFVVE